MASVCPSKDVCFKLNIPDSTASSGSGDIFFQISAPSSHEWVALGQGTSMAGSNMFLVYTSANGNNVTLSPRTASGYVPPDLNSEAQVTLLEGSGVANGIMTANVKCMYTSRGGAPRALSIAHQLIHVQAPIATVGPAERWTSSHRKETGSMHSTHPTVPRTPTLNPLRYDNTRDTTLSPGTLRLPRAETA